MKNIFLKVWPVLLFIFLGILGGFLYWRFIGCNSGTCPITSNWHLSSLAGGMIGYLGGSSITEMMANRRK